LSWKSKTASTNSVVEPLRKPLEFDPQLRILLCNISVNIIISYARRSLKLSIY
jgi:hypothetical protein